MKHALAPKLADELVEAADEKITGTPPNRRGTTTRPLSSTT
ncbi:hypothetical protein VSS38_06985 [Streptomyces albogriseolus]